MSASARLTAYFGADASGFNTVCDQVEGRLNTLTGTPRTIQISMGNGVVSDIESASSAVGGLMSSVTQLVGTYVGVKLLGEAFTGLKESVIDFNAMRQSAMVGFETQMKGDTKAAQNMMSELQKFAIPTPFRLADLAPLANQVLGYKLALKESADAGKQVVDVLRDAGDAAFGLSKGQEGVDHLVRALGTLNVAGRVNSHIMLEFTSMGIDAWGYLAQATGKTTAEVRKLTEQGLIPSKLAIQAIRAGIEQDFGGAMQRATKTWDGAWAQMLDSAQVALADGFKPLFNDLSDEAVSFAEIAGSPEMTAWCNELAAKSMYALTLTKELFIALVEEVRNGNPLMIAAIIALGSRFVWLGATAIFGAFLPAARAIIATLPIIAAGFFALALPMQVAIVAIGVFAYAYQNNIFNIRDYTKYLVDFVTLGAREVAVTIAQIVERLSWLVNKIPDKLLALSPVALLLKRIFGDQTGLTDGINRDFDKFDSKVAGFVKKTSESLTFANLGKMMVDGVENFLPDLDKIKAQAEAASKAAEVKPSRLEMPHIDTPDAGAGKVAKDAARDAKKELTEAASAWGQYASAVESAADRQIKTLDKLRDSLVGFVQELEGKLLESGADMRGFYGLVGQLQTALPVDKATLDIYDRSRHESSLARGKAGELRTQADAIHPSDIGKAAATGSSSGSASGATGTEAVSIMEGIAKQFDGAQIPSACATVAGKMMNAIGIHIEETAGARQLRENAKKLGAVEIPMAKAKMGDLINWVGPGYGSGGSGNHVGVYEGDGYYSGNHGGTNRNPAAVHEKVHDLAHAHFYNTSDFASGMGTSAATSSASPTSTTSSATVEGLPTELLKLLQEEERTRRANDAAMDKGNNAREFAANERAYNALRAYYQKHNISKDAQLSYSLHNYLDSAPAPTPLAHTETSALSGQMAGLNAKQQETARTIIAVGQQMGASHKVIASALATALMESTMGLHLINGNARGAFQQMPSWGSEKSRLDTSESAKRFYARAIKSDAKNPDLSINDLAQSVQASDKPNGYAKFEAQAKAILGSAGAGKPLAPAKAPVPALPTVPAALLALYKAVDTAEDKFYNAPKDNRAALGTKLEAANKKLLAYFEQNKLTNAQIARLDDLVRLEKHKVGGTLKDALSWKGPDADARSEASGTAKGDGKGPPRDAHDIKDEANRPKIKPWTKYDPSEIGQIPRLTEFNVNERAAKEMLARNDVRELMVSLGQMQKQFPALKGLNFDHFKALLPDLGRAVDTSDIVGKTREFQKESGDFVEGKNRETAALRVYSAALRDTAGNTLEASKASQIAKFEDEERDKLKLDKLKKLAEAETARAAILAQRVAAAKAAPGQKTPQEKEEVSFLSERAASSAQRAASLQAQITERQGQLTQRVTAFTRELNDQLRSDAYTGTTGRVKDLTNAMAALGDETIQAIAARKMAQREDRTSMSEIERQKEVLAETNLELAKLDREHTLKVRGIGDTTNELHYALDLLQIGISSDAEFAEKTKTHADQQARYLELIRKGVDANHAYSMSWREAFDESQNRGVQLRINALQELARVQREAERTQTLTKGNAEIDQAYSPDDPARARSKAIFAEAQKLLAEFKASGLKTFGAFGLDEKLEAFTKTYDTTHTTEQTQKLADAFWELDKATKSLNFAGSPIAGEKYDVTSGSNKNWSDKDKADYLADKLGTKRTDQSGTVIADLLNQQNDLTAQIAESLASRGKSLDSLDKLELEWKAKDAAAFAQFGQRSAEETKAIEAKRNEVRLLMKQLVSTQDVSNQVSSFQKLWGSAFEGIEAKGMRSFGDLFSGIASQFQQMVLKLAADQLWQSLGLGGLFGNLAGAALGGKPKGGGIVGAVTGGLSLAGGPIGPHKVDGSFASGLGYVPFDGFIGELHKGEAVLTAAQNAALPEMVATARRASEQSASLARGMMGAHQLSNLSTQAHLAAQTGSTAGYAAGGGGGNGGDSPIHINGPVHIHGVSNPQEVPRALAGAVLSHREATRQARRSLSYGSSDD